MMRDEFKQPLVIATLIACFCGLLGVAQPLDQIYWNMRFYFGQRQAPQSIVLVRTDPDRADSDAEAAKLLRKLDDQAPAHIYYDRKINSPAPELTKAFAQLGRRASVVARFSSTDTVSAGEIAMPPSSVVRGTQVVFSGWLTNFWGYGTETFYSIRIDGRDYPSLSAHIAGVDDTRLLRIRPDFSIDPATVPTITVRDVLENRSGASSLRGRKVIVTEQRTGAGSKVGYFSHGRIDPVYLDIAGVEGLRSGMGINVEWLPLVVLFVIAAAGVQNLRRARWRYLGYGLTAVAVLLVPTVIEKAAIYSNPSASLVAAFVYGSLKLWLKWRQRVLQTSRSGLPNFVALTERSLPADHDVIVAIISRYEEFLATLPSSLHGECARQIARRFAVGCGAEQIYHGEGGLFAWVEPTRPIDKQIEHLEGLRALFAAPLLVGPHTFDTNVHFGLERHFEHDLLTRLNTALASATEATKHGRTVEVFEAKRLANAAWELSLMARIDSGMRNGDIWLAYQPQWDYHEARISGAEALIRWNDPVRGPIRPDEFIIQAEEAGRIDALTYWVMEQAITSAENLNALGPSFQMSINLSAQLVDKPSLISSVREIVQRRGLDCRMMTIEVTETAGVCNRPAAIRNLSELRDMGFRLSIDDFGTGEASLTYLAELPSDELKLDRRFVSQIVHHERERHIVASTINLAHALNQTVVAEGIEDLATFELLRKLGCDVGQGYYIARPDTLEKLHERYTASLRSTPPTLGVVNHNN